MIRTSRSHPLRIDSVPVSSGARIGMTLCPGKRQRGAVSGHWERDLAEDLDVIRAWGASLVLTILEDHELDALGVRDIGAEIERRGMAWARLGIADAGIPDSGAERTWREELGPRIHEELRRGHDVLLHCKGGLGRTGMMAARLLVERGMEPERAISAIREARHGAIETAEQESCILSLRPPGGRSGA